MLIRHATPADAETLAAILVEIAPEGTIGPEPPVDEAAWTGRFREMIDAREPATIRVLEIDGRVVGYASLRESTRGVLLLGMAILASGRGRGAGRSLLLEMVGHARECGAHKIDLEVWVDNARAVALYVSTGFEVEGIKRDHYRRKDGTLRSAMLMAKHLHER